MGNDGQEDENREGVDPPVDADRRACGADRKRGQIGDHQDEDERSDDAGFVRDFLAEPAGTHDEAAYEESEDADCTSCGEYGGEVEVEAAEVASRIEKAKAEASGEVIECYKCEGTKSPEDEGVCEAGQRTFADDLGLAEYFPEEIPNALADG